MASPQKEQIRYMVFKEKGTWYAAALEFNIVTSGNNSDTALCNLFDAVDGYIDSCQKLKTNHGLFSQATDPDYEKLWHTIITGEALQSPLKMRTFGVLCV